MRGPSVLRRRSGPGLFTEARRMTRLVFGFIILCWLAALGMFGVIIFILFKALEVFK